MHPGGEPSDFVTDYTGLVTCTDDETGEWSRVGKVTALPFPARNQRPAACSRAVTVTPGYILPVRPPVAATEAVCVHLLLMSASTSTPPLPSLTEHGWWEYHPSEP